MPLQPGAIVGGYRVLRVLGSGGMGTVYLAQNPTLPRRDALKVLSADLSTDPEFRARFEREANLAAGLDHPNIVTVYNRGEEHGQLWIAMQYVEGTDAAEEAKKGPAAMPAQRALRIVSEVGKGLDYAHRRGLLHRDVKPANFLLSTADGDEERVLLTDFGVAKSAEDGQDLTTTGQFMATVAYASPEQLTGDRLDHRSDIYSLGCSFYRLLTGQNPYPAPMPAVVMMGHLHEAPPKISAIRPDLPAGLDGVIARVMSKDPAYRYNSCREFVQDAEAALFGARPQFPAQISHFRTDPRAPVGYPPPRRQDTNEHLIETLRNGGATSNPSRRKTLTWASAALIAILAVAAGVFYFTTQGARSPATGGSDELAQVRSKYPQFDGKSVTAFNYGNGTLSVVLTPSEQSKFLQGIGFRYANKYKAVGDEKSPRQLSAGGYSSDLIDSDVVIILRTDDKAGNGGLGGLPSKLLPTNATVVAIDDPSAIQAFQVWTDQSTKTLIDKMVPAIGKVVT
ncbi:serine/threonine-protein kinase [Nocardia transvalensis]|uniref:serine/threonine-protein kinase n=1 Tax=Nocardia transvalensis TaxID=37333 RepID=UPI001893626E|nr:serine/threonine-protein kinase [Nocardia transvalensis]MBF6327475.1 serine/threonine protein kinase [Nocardia transvalensis]